MRAWIVILAGCFVAVASGCGSQDASTPAACLEGPRAFAQALKAAPEEVRLDGGTAISECLTQHQKAGDLGRVGEAMVLTATHLNIASRAEPEGDAAVQLGYLIGAVRRGAQDTEGIHSDLIRRLTVAANYRPAGEPLQFQFHDDYAEGFEAGRSDG